MIESSHSNGDNSEGCADDGEEAGAEVVGRAFDVETGDLDGGEEAGDDEGGGDEVAGGVGGEVGAARAGDEDGWRDAGGDCQLRFSYASCQRPLMICIRPQQGLSSHGNPPYRLLSPSISNSESLWSMGKHLHSGQHGQRMLQPQQQRQKHRHLIIDPKERCRLVVFLHEW